MSFSITSLLNFCKKVELVVYNDFLKPVGHGQLLMGLILITVVVIL